MYSCTSFHAFLFTRPKSGSWRAGLGAAAVRTPCSRRARQVPGAGVLFHRVSVTGAPHAGETAARGCVCCCRPLPAPTRPRAPEERQVGSGSARDLPDAVSARAEMRARSELFSSACELRNPRPPPQGSEVGSKPVRDSVSLIIEQIFISHLLCGLGWPRC